MKIPSRTVRSLTPALFFMASSSRSFSVTHSQIDHLTRTQYRQTNMLGAATSTSSVQYGIDVTIPPENLQAIDKLEPQSLWTQFAVLSSIPRPSKQEEAVLQYIQNFAETRNLKWKQDAVGNLVVFHPGCGVGREAPPVIMQGHVDMVTEKNSGTAHNFETDPILLRRFERNGHEAWLGAHATTLGADNGIGVAASLALLDTPVSEESIDLPPLEVLFTVDEETGLTGAMELDTEALGLTGKTMLNLDTEEWGELYVGCAGGGESTITLPLQREEEYNDDGSMEIVEIKVEGLLGGHSGLNIHEGRANAVSLCAQAVQAALEQNDGTKLLSLSGGDKHNAIPREARAQLLVPGAVMDNVKKSVQKSEEHSKAEYGLLEGNLKMSVEGGYSDSCSAHSKPLAHESASRLVSMILALPHGPIKFSHAMPELVETSNNVASLSMSEDGMTANVLCSTRSSVRSALENARNKLSAIAALAGASIEKLPSYPGWNPNMNSEVLALASKILSDRLGRSPGVKAIHAGLECGLLIEKLGGDVDALSFGPTITGAHSPDESIHIETVGPFFDLVKEILSELAKKRA